MYPVHVSLPHWAQNECSMYIFCRVWTVFCPLLRRAATARMRTWRKEERGANKLEKRNICPGTSAGLPYKDPNGHWEDLTWRNSIATYEWRRHQFLRNWLAPSWSYSVLVGQDNRGNQKLQSVSFVIGGYFRHCWGPLASLSSTISFIPEIMTLYVQGHRRHLFSPSGRSGL